MDKKSTVAVIGAGIAGLSVVPVLKEQGYEVCVFEAGDTLRGIGAGMGLAANALKAFDYLGLADAVKDISNPLPSFVIYDAQKMPLITIDVDALRKNYGIGNYAVHRADLHQLLLERVQDTPIYTQKRLERVALQEAKVTISFTDGTRQCFDFVIGADGLGSRVRQEIIPNSPPKYAGYWCWRQVIKDPQLTLEGSMAVWDKNGRFGITPLLQNQFYWFACINAKSAPNHFDIQELQKQFAAYPDPIPQLLRQSKDKDLIGMPVLDIDPISKFHVDRVLLIGDAAHATTPNMGQGACMAVEDVAILQDELRQHDWWTACQNFERRRLNRNRYIIKNSRRAGKLAQLDKEFLVRLRNQLFKSLPAHLVQRPIKRLLQEDFMKS